MIKRLFFIIVLLTGTLNARLVFACQCIQLGINEDVSRSDVIFSGRLIKAKELGPADKNFVVPFEMTFEVERYWKGEISKQFVLHTVKNTIHCNGYPFKEGESYLIFAYRYSRYPDNLDWNKEYYGLTEKFLYKSGP